MPAGLPEIAVIRAFDRKLSRIIGNKHPEGQPHAPNVPRLAQVNNQLLATRLDTLAISLGPRIAVEQAADPVVADICHDRLNGKRRAANRGSWCPIRLQPVHAALAIVGDLLAVLPHHERGPAIECISMVDDHDQRTTA